MGTCALRTMNDEISVMNYINQARLMFMGVVLEESNAQTSPEFFFSLGFRER